MLTRSWLRRLEPPDSSYEIARTVFLRSLGFIYFVAFLSLNRQVLALIGADGILPAKLFLDRVHQAMESSTFDCFLQLPSLFWLNRDDAFLLACSYAGLILSILIMLGATNALLMLAQWFLYLSFVQIGQIFYGYGWESMTLEAGFLAIFLCPVSSIGPFPQHHPAPKVIFWFYRWMLFRVMFGAGMIKIRGDECWRNLTCLVYHYETQPIPNPLSWYLHQMPVWFHQGGCLFNHFVELIVPWFYFAPRRLRHIAGLFTIVFQTILILSGNLSFLNWLTIVIAIPCFDDAAFSRIGFRIRPRPGAASASRKYMLAALSLLLIWLSTEPARNMMSSGQVMNTSFDRLYILNTYGAFGSVTRTRYEIIIEGSDDAVHWKEYEFLAKPGDPKRAPPWIAPYQSRIDWQMWFAAMSDYQNNPWFVHFVYKLLVGDHAVLNLLKTNPFPTAPPRLIRADLYEYHFSKDHAGGAWWNRKRVGTYLRTVWKDSPDLQYYLREYGWIR